MEDRGRSLRNSRPCPTLANCTAAGTAPRCPGRSRLGPRRVNRPKRPEAHPEAGCRCPGRPRCSSAARTCSPSRWSRAPPAPPPLPRTNRTSLVPPPVLTGHAPSAARSRARAQCRRQTPAPRWRASRGRWRSSLHGRRRCRRRCRCGGPASPQPDDSCRSLHLLFMQSMHASVHVVHS